MCRPKLVHLRINDNYITLLLCEEHNYNFKFIVDVYIKYTYSAYLDELQYPLISKDFETNAYIENTDHEFEYCNYYNKLFDYEDIITKKFLEDFNSYIRDYEPFIIKKSGTEIYPSISETDSFITNQDKINQIYLDDKKIKIKFYIEIVSELGNDNCEKRIKEEIKVTFNGD